MRRDPHKAPTPPPQPPPMGLAGARARDGGRPTGPGFADSLKLACTVAGVAHAALVLLAEGRMHVVAATASWPASYDRLRELLCLQAIDTRGIVDTAGDGTGASISGASTLGASAVPLLTETGEAIGAICLIDAAPRRFDADKREALAALARHCVRLLDLRHLLHDVRQAEERLKLVFESATDYAIVCTDLDGRITSWNKGAELIFGWEPEAALGQSFDLLFTPGDRDLGHPARDLSLAAANGRELHERYYQRKNRSQFWGSGETMPLRAGLGVTCGYLTILCDRTTQKRIKEALEYQSGILQAITDHLGEALFQVDTDHRVTFMNPAAEAMFGWSRYELLGVNLHERLHHHPAQDGGAPGEDCPYVVAMKSRAALQRRSDRFVHRDGRLIDVVLTFTPIVAEGTVTGALLTLVDVTDTLKTEEALRRTRERYQLAVSASGLIGSWEWDVTSGTVFADATFADQYGLDVERAAAGARFADVVAAIHPEDRAPVLLAIDRSISNRAQLSREFRLSKPDGSVLWVAVHARGQYDAAGHPLRYIGLSEDISARKRSEERRAAVLDLEDRLRNTEEVGDIVAAAAEMVCLKFDAMRCGFCSFEACEGHGSVERDHVRGDAPSLVGALRLQDFGTYAEELRRGHFIVIDDLPESEGEGRALAPSAVLVPLIAEDRLVGIFFVHGAEPRLWSEEEVALLRNVADRIWAAIVRAEGHARQKILTGELHHRMKNTMTMVQAIARQTMRRATSLEDAVSAFEARLMALSAAQDVLTRTSWSSASMAQIVEGTLRPHRPARPNSLVVDGPEVNLSPQNALSFALAFHELATNATKYGAFSNDSGCVRISWRIDEAAGGPRFVCTWREEDGPPVRQPDHKGYGSRLIKGVFAGAFTVDLTYDPTGLSARFEASVAAL